MSDDVANNRALFEIYNRNLQKLEQQQALVGFDLALTNQIEQTRKLIRKSAGNLRCPKGLESILASEKARQ